MTFGWIHILCIIQKLTKAIAEVAEEMGIDIEADELFNVDVKKSIPSGMMLKNLLLG